MLSKSANSIQGYPEVPTTPEAEVPYLEVLKVFETDRHSPAVGKIVSPPLCSRSGRKLCLGPGASTLGALRMAGELDLLRILQVHNLLEALA